MKTASVQLSKSRDDLRREFFALKSPRHVAALLEVDYAHLTYLLYRSPVKKRYEIFSIAKRSGAQRLLMKPAPSLAIAQGKLLEVFNAVYRPRRCVQGFAEERSIVGNAAIHARSGAVLNADLLDFFPSINFGRVRGMLIARPYGLPPAVATVLAQLCCFNNQLPQGAPTSPIVANMLCARLDAELLRLAKSCGARYSRYADDLTFSTNGDTFDDQIAVVAGRTVQLGSALRHVIFANGFKVNPAKIHLRKPSERQEVTGLVVNRKPNVRRTRVRQIRAMLHALHRWGPTAAEAEFHSKYAYRRYYPVGHKPDFRRVLRGRISFVGMVRGRHDALYLRLHNRY
jgi:RNA-directed DNA polymerase